MDKVNNEKSFQKNDVEIFSKIFNSLENKDKNIKNNKLSKNNYIDINKNIKVTIILINFSEIKKVEKTMENY